MRMRAYYGALSLALGTLSGCAADIGDSPQVGVAVQGLCRDQPDPEPPQGFPIGGPTCRAFSDGTDFYSFQCPAESLNEHKIELQLQFAGGTGWSSVMNHDTISDGRRCVMGDLLAGMNCTSGGESTTWVEGERIYFSLEPEELDSQSDSITIQCPPEAPIATGFGRALFRLRGITPFD